MCVKYKINKIIILFITYITDLTSSLAVQTLLKQNTIHRTNIFVTTYQKEDIINILVFIKDLYSLYKIYKYILISTIFCLCIKLVINTI